MKKYASVWLAALLMLLLCGSAQAAEPEAETYIFKIKTAVTLSDEITDDGLDVGAVLEEAEEVFAELGYYRTDDPALLQTLRDAGMLAHYVVDAQIYLDGFDEDAAYYQNRDWRQALLGSKYAADYGITGSGVRVAVIDSGLISDFSDFSSADIVEGINYLASAEDAQARANTNDTYGHGTFVTSVIADRTIGFAPDVMIIPLKCFDANKGKVSDVMQAIRDAIDLYQCDVINLSMGIGTDEEGLRDAVQYALDAGVIVVAATGNLGHSTGDDAVNYPAAYEGVIGVGSVDRTGTISSTSVQNESVMVVAPGAKVWGLSNVTKTYREGSGTSYAAPVVTAAAALALSADDTLTADAFRMLLVETAEDRGVVGYDYSYGHGLVNIGLLLAAIRGDNEELILSACDGSYRISACANASDEESRWIAFYDQSGRMRGIAGLGQHLSSHTLPDGFSFLKLFRLDPAAWMPSREPQRYGKMREESP